MGILSLLNDTLITHYGQTYDIALNFIGQLINTLVNGIGIVGVGIIVFSLILKAIVLPFDIIQRVNMRKQNQKMAENKDKLEKLQKQYANDKQKYNEKLMEFQKANGMNMFASCLPMILSIVIFFVAIGAFNSYSQYANMSNYNEMATAYNQTIEYYTAEVDENNVSYSIQKQDGSWEEYTTMVDGTTHLTYKEENTPGKYIFLRVPVSAYTEGDLHEYAQNVVDGKVFQNGGIIKPYYVVDTVTALANSEISAEVTTIMTNNAGMSQEDACAEYFRMKARDNVVKVYNESVSGKMSFLWIKNIWQTDAMYKHPILSYSDFTMGMGNEGFATPYQAPAVSLADMGNYTDVYKEGAYDEITKNLGAQKAEFNGYFILIVLSIGTILLQQIITMKAQKAQNQFSTVDGQGGSQSKMMLVVMTGMFAIFSFMYSSAFSIYMITSNIISLASMLIINKIVDVVMEKKESKTFQEKHSMKVPKNTKKK